MTTIYDVKSSKSPLAPGSGLSEAEDVGRQTGEEKLVTLFDGRPSIQT